jgi:hypothetical protein
MNIKDFFAAKENPPELYWSLVIEPGFVQAGIWYIKDQKTEVVDTSPVTTWSEDEDLTGAVDAALSSCVQKLPEDFEEPTKTVFGVSSSWVTGGEIKEEYLDKIKKICSELSLTPSGFVVLPEAISHYFKFLEGSPLNAIVVGLRNQELEISVFQTGNLIGTTQVARSVSIIDDCIEGLTRFEGATPLPSRIILYDGKGGELDEAKNTLSGGSWDESEKVKFLHAPKVEALESEKKVTAVSLAGATEIGGVSEMKMESDNEDKNLLPAPAVETAKDLGFVVTNDEVGKPPELSTKAAPVTLPVVLLSPPKDYLKIIRETFLGIYKSLSSKSTILLAVFGAILIGIFTFWWFYPKAVVTIYVSPKSFEEEFDMAFDSEEIVETSVSGEKTKNTSGVKLVGDRAKGSVQVRNGTALPINLAAGTVIFSSGNLEYTLDESASVSAAISPGTPGTANSPATAGSIGAEHNLAKDETFKVGNYPRAEVDAVATADFSGGSSREISAVSEDDADKLREELEAELLEKAKIELTTKTTGDNLFIGDLTSFDESDESFSHKVGDEADSVKLSLTMDAKGVVTDRKKLAEAVKEKIKDNIPTGFILRDTQISYEFEFKEEDSNGDSVFGVVAKVNFLPEVNQDEIIGKISGRLPNVVESYLASVPGFSRAEIRINPHFPGRFGTLPRVKKNITIEIASER